MMEIYDDNIEFIEAKATPEIDERLRRVRALVEQGGGEFACAHIPWSPVDPFARLTGPGLDGVSVEVKPCK